MDALTIVTAIAVLLFVGVISSWMAQKIKVPDVLLLILAGMLFGNVIYRGEPLIQFPELFLTSMAMLALAMIVFDSAARLRLREFDTFSVQALKLTMINLFLNVIVMSLSAYFILGIDPWLAVLFSTIIAGTSPDILLPMEPKKKTRGMTLLKLESVFNTPLTVLLPFIVIDLMQSVRTEIVTELIEQLVPFVMKFIVGLGAGVFVGIVLFKIMQRAYTEVYSPLAVIVAALLSYVLAEALGGSGVLAVTALGLFFGNVYVKEKLTLLNIEEVLTKALFIFVFLLVGLIIKVPLTKDFAITAGSLLLIFYLTRFIGVSISQRNDTKSTFKEKVFLTLNAPKGIATAAVVFILAIESLEGLNIILDLTLTFVLVTIVLSSIVMWMAPWFLDVNKSK